jgi:hypothetical protein
MQVQQTTQQKTSLFQKPNAVMVDGAMELCVSSVQMEPTTMKQRQGPI